MSTALYNTGVRRWDAQRCIFVARGAWHLPRMKNGSQRQFCTIRVCVWGGGGAGVLLNRVLKLWRSVVEVSNAKVIMI